MDKFNSDLPALRHYFMNIDDPAGTPTMSDKSTQITWHRYENALNIVKFLKVHG